MKKVFEKLYKNATEILVIFFLAALLVSCSNSKNLCDTYAYNKTQKNMTSI